MNLERIEAKCLRVLGTVLAGAALFGCSTPAVGAPCLPEQVPESGFDDREAYIESSSVQCQTRVCIVYHLAGDPRKDCKPVPAPTNCKMGDPGCVPGKVCALADATDESVYCTCRCDSGQTGFAECECPAGFACQPVLEQGSDGVRGGYCVKKKSISSK